MRRDIQTAMPFPYITSYRASKCCSEVTVGGALLTLQFGLGTFPCSFRFTLIAGGLEGRAVEAADERRAPSYAKSIRYCSTKRLKVAIGSISRRGESGSGRKPYRW